MLPSNLISLLRISFACILYNQILEVVMDIYTALKKDHDEMKNMLKQLQQNSVDEELFDKFRTEMSMHNRAEEDTFYHRLAEKLNSLGLITTSSKEEHGLVDEMVAIYGGLEEKEKNILIRAIKKSVENHISKEEEEVFNLAKESFSSTEQEEILNEFQDAKERIKENIDNIAVD